MAITNSKLPPFGVALAERQRFNNLPFLAVVCVGLDAWESAKQWNANADHAAMVLPAGEKPSIYTWLVMGCRVIIEWNTGPNETQIIELVACLFRAGAECVIVRPLFTQPHKPCVLYDTEQPIGQRFVQVQQPIKVYRQPAQEVRDAA